MMRSIEKFDEPEIDNRELAELASSSINAAIDDRSEYRVGAAISIEFRDAKADYQKSPGNLYGGEHMGTFVYCGSNINMSGMQIKVHAEQLALFQAILDIEEKGMDKFAKLRKVMVVTSEDDLALKCGHCLQTFAGVCNYYGWDKSKVRYNAAAGSTMYDDRGNPDGVHYMFELNTLEDLIGDTYVDKS